LKSNYGNINVGGRQDNNMEKDKDEQKKNGWPTKNEGRRR